MFSKWIFDQDLTTWSLLLELFVCGFFVIVVASRLTHVADRISDELNLGKAWIGMVGLATVTSLPELVTGGTSVLLGEPDLAFGNIMGSCMFNVAIIVLLNAMLPGGSILSGSRASHSLSSALGIILITMGVLGFAVMGRLAQPHADGSIPTFVRVAELGYCLLIAMVYLNCMRLIYRFERHLAGPTGPVERIAKLRAPVDLYLKFAIMAVMLIVLTIWLTTTGNVLGDHPIGVLGGRRLGATFVGAFFLAVATSLPEITTSIAAVKLGHLDLALGNIFGSNMFNIFIIPILKVVSLAKGEALLLAGPGISVQSHILTGLFAIIITAIAVVSLMYPTKRRFGRFGADSVIIGVVYVLGMFLLLST